MKMREHREFGVLLFEKSEELGTREAERDDIVDLAIIRRRGDAVIGEEEVLVLMKAMVPVGARTLTCPFRKPCSVPRAMTSSQVVRTVSSRSVGIRSRSRRYAASRCLAMTARYGFSFRV